MYKIPDRTQFWIVYDKEVLLNNLREKNFLRPFFTYLKVNKNNYSKNNIPNSTPYCYQNVSHKLSYSICITS